MLTHHPWGRLAIFVISHSNEYEVIGTGQLANAAIPKEIRAYCRFRFFCRWVLPPRCRAAIGELKAPYILIVRYFGVLFLFFIFQNTCMKQLQDLYDFWTREASLMRSSSLACRNSRSISPSPASASFISSKTSSSLSCRIFLALARNTFIFSFCCASE